MVFKNMEHYPSAIINYQPYLFLCNFSYQRLRISSDFNIFLRTVYVYSKNLEKLGHLHSVVSVFAGCSYVDGVNFTFIFFYRYMSFSFIYLHNYYMIEYSGKNFCRTLFLQ